MQTMSKRAKITKRYVDELPFPETGQIIYQDSELTGFAIRVTPTKKTFIVNKRVGGQLIRHKIAAYPELTAEQARVEAQKLLGNIAKGLSPKEEQKRKQVGGITLTQAFVDFLAAKTHKPTTIKDYNQAVYTYLAPFLNKRLTDIRRNDVLTLYQEITKRSPAFSNLSMRVLRAIFNFAKAKYRLDDDTPLILENPVSIISETRTWNRIKRRTRLISIQELPIWYKALMSLPRSPDSNVEVIQDYLLFVLFTGLRRNEALGLTWDQVSFHNKTFTVLDTKNHSDHTLPIPQFLEALLKRRKQCAKSPYLFSALHGQKGLNDPKKVIAKVVKESGVPFSTHDLRRTFITIAESLDIPHYALKRLLNHKANNDVTSGYIINDVERLREPMERVAGKIETLCFNK